MNCNPKRPSHLSRTGEECLYALADAGLGEYISVGGAVGLLHYLDYRQTHDIDAWWTSKAGTPERKRVVDVLLEALARGGETKTRSWGDVVSLELLREGRTVFSFQIAARSAQLEPSRVAPWVNVRLDSLPDLIASKMTALVERGAPRDFRDIHAVCKAGHTTPADCWDLWRRRQDLSGGGHDLQRARLALETHLQRIEQHRPLAEIAELPRREEAAAIRNWFTGEFLDVLRVD